MSKKQIKKQFSKIALSNKQKKSNFSNEDNKKIRITLFKKERLDIISIIDFLEANSEKNNDDNSLFSSYERKIVADIKKKFFYESKPIFFRYELNLLIEVVKRISVFLEKSNQIEKKLNSFYKKYYKNNIFSNKNYIKFTNKDKELQTQLSYMEFKKKLPKSFKAFKNFSSFIWYSFFVPISFYIIKIASILSPQLVIYDKNAILKKTRKISLLLENSY